MLAGYKLISEKTGETVLEWGGVWGQCPGVPNPIIVGDLHLHGIEPGQSAFGYRLEEWNVEAPPPQKYDVQVERDRRMDAGFFFDKVMFQSRQEDRENVAGAVSWASLAIMAGAQPGDYRWHGGEDDFAWIAADNSLVKMDAQTVVDFGKALAAWKSGHIFAARALKDMDPIPADFADSKYWPKE